MILFDDFFSRNDLEFCVLDFVDILATHAILRLSKFFLFGNLYPSVVCGWTTGLWILTSALLSQRSAPGCW